MAQIQSEMAVASWSGRGSLSDLVAELERQKESKFDFVSDTRSIAVEEREGKLFLIPKEDRATEWISSSGLLIRPGAARSSRREMRSRDPGQIPPGAFGTKASPGRRASEQSDRRRPCPPVHPLSGRLGPGLPLRPLPGAG